MGKLESIENAIQTLSPDELAQFRAWFVEFDWDAWERQIASDVGGGKLDDLAEHALRQHSSGKTTPL